MASCGSSVRRVLSGCQSLLLLSGSLHPSLSPLRRNLPIRTFAAVRAVKKSRKEEKKEVKEVKKGRREEEEGERVKPFGKVSISPLDDVFILSFYPRLLLRPQGAVESLKSFQRLDHTDPQQQVYADLRLDMRLEKKKRVDPFVGVLQFPHNFQRNQNRILVFTEDPLEAKVAKENGAAIVGGAELIQPILEDQISADFYLSVPEVLPKLVPLKNKLRKKFPKGKRGSVGVDLVQMLSVYRSGVQYQVEDDCYVRLQIATLDMTSDLILDNLRTLLTEVAAHRPPHLGPFILRSLLSSQTSESLWFRSEDLLPVPVPEGAEPNPPRDPAPTQ